ncbi:F0F1 ATP synthase subunit gamma [Dichotomicrobium thermohalophilum]|uniref:ATP synthase gamma chain n=1 Tax=Dichotomicrobium thermohalophilum TaxID=933063 RepID=A0A397PDY5_9HYPH|nr:F0F1 ATP synthase subunit gamma [Dichotomicrobium thermohalophilum]RIA47710.1 ATP synthase F1 subcomplex gamma subunit [Dichotomicrobium thermohalophilum]
MASLKDMRNRISSVKATQKITKAMQMVAAAKLRKAQEAADAARPYAEKMDQVLGNLNARVVNKEAASPLLVGTGREDVHLIVVATADRGLCGAFNANIAKKARQIASGLIAEGKDVKFLCVGSKGYDMLKRDHGRRIVDVIDMKSVKRVGFDDAHAIAQRVLAMFDKGEFDVCTLVFSEFVNTLTQRPKHMQLIPASLPEEGAPEEGAPTADYIFEPDEEDILRDLLPRNVATQIFRALLENAAGEQGARMTAMDNATRNAGELIDNLTLTYNRMRQDQITKELIEIVSGAEAIS